MSTYDRIADLPLHVDDYTLEGLEEEISSEFERHTTVVTLHGGGAAGCGEDVTYDSVDHENLLAEGPSLPLAGDWTMRSFAEHLETLELFAQAPQEEVSRRYRRWAYESAALDLALRQAGKPLHEVVERVPRELSFIVSLRLGEPPSLEPLTARLERCPQLRFKVDPTSDWDEELIEALARTGTIELIDFKGHYEGSMMEQEPDPELYRRVLSAFTDAWIEDPKLTPKTRDLLAPHRDRITWDGVLHCADDIAALPYVPRLVNFKPSRIGSVERLFDAYDYAAAHGVGAYGGGMFELGPGRGQIQYLASLFHPDAPNDTAPAVFNDVDPPDELPESPLAPAPPASGFRWGEAADRMSGAASAG